MPIVAVLLLLGTVVAPVLAAPREAVIVVSPHPDDESILAAGTIRRLAADRRTRLSAVYVSGGDRATLPGPCGGIPEVRKTRLIVTLRERETRAAWRVLAPGRQVPLKFLRGPDQGLVAHSTLVGGRRVDELSPAGERAVAGAVRWITRLPRSIRHVRLITAAPYDAHPDHRAAYRAARLAGERLRARGATVRLWSFIVHDEIAQVAPALCCLGDLLWPPAGPTHAHAALLDTTARPRPPLWNVSVDVRDLGSVRRDAITRHLSQVEGRPDLCMVDFVPNFYSHWWEKTEEPFYEEVLP